jgi:hypothetical protein
MRERRHQYRTLIAPRIRPRNAEDQYYGWQAAYRRIVSLVDFLGEGCPTQHAETLRRRAMWGGLDTPAVRARNGQD